MTTNSPEIDEIGDALERLESDMGAAECHGIMAGLLCAAGWMDKARWLKQMFPSVEAGDLLAREAIDALARLYEETARQLDDAVLDFHLLLPDDDEPLDERIEALAEWCQGFLLGMSEGGMKDLAALPADSSEVMRDLVEIARAGGYDLEEGEEDEVAYNELLEYVRTGVLLINEELNPTQAPPQDNVTLH
jgi:yecA family protein